MLMIRKLLKILRGQVTPLQVFMACMIGGAIGFMPGLAQAPGLIVALTLLLVMLNTPLALAGVAGLLAGLVSLVLMPASFHLGRVLLDGPTQPIFQTLINAPVLALFGFEYYATTGGLVLGVVFGAVVAVGVLVLLKVFRTRMASLEEGSSHYQDWANKKWVKVLTWIVAGGGPKQGYKALMEAKKRTQPVRILGVVFAVVVIGLGALVQMFASGPIVAMALQAGLERANGATVTLDHAEVSLREGRLELEGLAMADPNALDTDIFRAARVEADLSVTDLLRKRLSMNRLVASDASSGEKRVTPGRRTSTAPQPDREPKDPDEKSVEDYMADAEKWKGRLAQLRQWLERLSGPGEEPETAEEREALRDRLARRVDELGYGRVRAEHLVDGAPTLLVRELLAEKVRLRQLEDETVDIHGQNLSTHAHLVEEPARITVRSSGGTLLADISLDEAAAGGAGRDNRITFELRNFPGDRIGAALAVAGTRPVSGGTVDLSSEGTWRRGEVDLPLNVTLRDTTLAVPGGRSQRVGRFDLPLGVRGPLDNPTVLLDDDALTDALVQAGANELTDRAQQEAERAIDRATDEASERLGDEVSDRLRGFFGSDE